MMCEQCHRFLGPSKGIYKEVYKNRELCLNCRKDAGEIYLPGSLERILVDFEKRAIHVLPNTENARLSAI